MNHRFGITMALLLVVAALSILPTASAHDCAAYNGCDAGACTEGEDHNHKDYNYVERDETCSSKAEPKPTPPPPCVPAILCGGQKALEALALA